MSTSFECILALWINVNVTVCGNNVELNEPVAVCQLLYVHNTWFRKHSVLMKFKFIEKLSGR